MLEKKTHISFHSATLDIIHVTEYFSSRSCNIFGKQGRAVARRPRLALCRGELTDCLVRFCRTRFQIQCGIQKTYVALRDTYGHERGTG